MTSHMGRLKSDTMAGTKGKASPAIVSRDVSASRAVKDIARSIWLRPTPVAERGIPNDAYTAHREGDTLQAGL